MQVFIFIILIIWSWFSSFLLIDKPIDLMVCYLFYLLVSFIILYISRKDILSPLGLIVIISFYCFGFNIPFFAVGILSQENLKYEVLFSGDYSIKDKTVMIMLIILTAAQISFVIGYKTDLYKKIFLSKIINIKYASRKVSFFQFIILISVVAISGFIRIKLHLGEAGIQPNFKFAGIAQYVLFNGVITLCLLFLAQGMRQSKIYLILGLISILGIVFTQVLLSWRGGILHLLIMVFFVFRGNQIKLNQVRFKGIIWLLCLGLSAPIFVQYGNSIRSERLGGQKNFSQSVSGFLFNVMNRSQGTTRLAVVVNDIGELSFTNDFKFIYLLENGLSTTKYIDQKLYGVRPNQSHSVGTSGLGGPYIACGLLGVISAFMLYGVIYRASYEVLLKSHKYNVFGIVWYSIMSFFLLDTLSENFNINTLKFIFALAIIMFFLSSFLHTKYYTADSVK